MEPIGFIYMTINKINNRKYIGQHTKFNDNYLGSGKILKQAIEKYGLKNFERVILDYAYTQEELNLKEKHYIEINDAVKDKSFYNIHIGGMGGDTFSGKTEEEKEEFKGKMSSITQGKNNGMYGKSHSLSTRNKMKANWSKTRGKLFTEEFKKKMSLVTKGIRNGMYGKKHSEESKKKMSENSKGKTLGEKNGMYGKKGDKAINGKKVYQFVDVEHNELIQDFTSVQCVLQYLGLKGHSGLIKAIKNNSKYKGFYWSKERKA